MVYYRYRLSHFVYSHMFYEAYMYILSYILVGILAYGPVAAVAQEVQVGQWPDGAKMAFQCQPGTSGKIKFLFLTPDGTEYTGVMSCGTSI
jgi:hypothetical protein